MFYIIPGTVDGSGVRNGCEGGRFVSHIPGQVAESQLRGLFAERSNEAAFQQAAELFDHLIVSGGDTLIVWKVDAQDFLGIRRFLPAATVVAEEIQRLPLAA